MWLSVCSKACQGDDRQGCTCLTAAAHAAGAGARLPVHVPLNSLDTSLYIVGDSEKKTPRAHGGQQWRPDSSGWS
eukprot:scaffold18086_cov112-Isochrysis_galbana.AAC.7